MDARLHYLQGKADRVKVGDLGLLLEEFRREKLAMLDRHQRTAQLVRQYDANNAYQYVISREEVQLSWLSSAIAGLEPRVGRGTENPESGPGGASGVAAPPRDRTGAAERAAVEEDVREAEAFVDRWRPRVEAVDDARHRGMLGVVLGETIEHGRFFQQALAGRTDMLGRRAQQVAPAAGAVLPTRWIE